MVLVKIFNKIIKFILISIIFTWTLPVFFVLFLIKKKKKIKFGKIRSDRIGHFGIEIGILASRIKEEKNTIFLFCFDHYISNKYLATVAKQKLNIYNFVKYLYITSVICPFFFFFIVKWMIGRDIKGHLYKRPFQVKFTNKENVSAKNWLIENGWSEGEKFYCLLVRDDAYLQNNKYLNKNNITQDWSYHNYRDSDIKTYKSGIEWLASKKIWVIRMGRNVNKPVNSTNRYIIDYAFNCNKSDELDIWLLTNCDALISTGTGIESVSQLALKPILFLNVMPLKNINSFYECIWAPKNLIWEKSLLPLKLKDYIQHTYLKTSEYENSKILIEDLSEEVILECIKEFFNFVSSTSTKIDKIKKKKKKFWEFLCNSIDFNLLHEWIHPKCKVSTTWLNKQNTKFFLD